MKVTVFAWGPPKRREAVALGHASEDSSEVVELVRIHLWPLDRIGCTVSAVLAQTDVNDTQTGLRDEVCIGGGNDILGVVSLRCGERVAPSQWDYKQRN